MSLLDHFWGLASDDLNERLSAGEALLKGLQEKKSEEDWTYALKRLVRGLSSSRGSARLGFSMALAELLQQRASEVTVKQYLALCNDSFEVSGNMKGNEERGLLFGRLFALKILAKSPLWNKETTSSSDLVAFVEMAISLALRKAWLREPPFFALCELVQRLASNKVFFEGIASAFKLVHEKGLSMSCEGVALALSVSPGQRTEFNSGYGWEKGDPLDKRNLSALSRALREMPVSSGDVSQSKPYIHFVWSYLLAEFIKTGGPQSASAEPPSKKRKSEMKAKKGSSATEVSLADFWKSAVDRDFFGSDTSSERKMWGFEIFLLWCQEPNLPEVVPLFSPNFIKTLSLQLGQKDRNLNKIAKKVVNVITDTLVTQRPRELISVISQFMIQSPNFDKLSKTKLVHQLLGAVNDEKSIAELVQTLLKSLRSSAREELVRKQWIFDNLVQLVRNVSNPSVQLAKASGSGHAAAPPLPWISDIFRELIPLAYFVNVKESKSGESESNDDQVAKMAQDRVMSILSATLGKSVQGVTPDPQSSWPFIVFQLILSLQKEHPEYETRVEFDQETLKAVDKAEHTLHKIHKKRNSSRHVDSSQLQAFELLFAMVILQVYGSTPDAVSMLDELQMCYNKINKKARVYDDSGDAEIQDDEEPSMVLTEILISLLSQQSVVLRKLSEDVWRTFSDQFSEGSLTLLCDILSAQEGTDGQRSLFDVEDESDQEDDEDEDESEDEEEHEEAGQAEEDEDSGSDDRASERMQSGGAEGDDTANDNTASGSDSEYELDEAAKAKLAGALRVNSDAAAGSDDADSSDEDSMDDDQMSALDVHLATIFRERRKIQSKAQEKRKENSRAKQNVVQLKGRVLDLLDIYFAAQPEKLVGLICIEPLLNFIGITKEGRLAEKARELIRTRICRKTSYTLSSEEEIMRSLELLKTIHSTAAQSKSKILSLSCNQVSVFLSKLVIAFDPALISAVANIYNTSMQTWFLQNGNQTLPNMFIDFVNFLDTKRKS